jgi:hypothetical protein
VVEDGGESRIFEVHEQATGGVEPIVVDQPPQERGFARAPNALHDQRDIGPQFRRQRN